MSVNETRTREQLEAYITQAMRRASDKQLRAMAGMLDAFGEARISDEVPAHLCLPDEETLVDALQATRERDTYVPESEAHRRLLTRYEAS